MRVREVESYERTNTQVIIKYALTLITILISHLINR
jgi:hypothetical protein